MQHQLNSKPVPRFTHIHTFTCSVTLIRNTAVNVRTSIPPAQHDVTRNESSLRGLGAHLKSRSHWLLRQGLNHSAPVGRVQTFDVCAPRFEHRPSH